MLLSRSGSWLVSLLRRLEHFDNFVPLNPPRLSRLKHSANIHVYTGEYIHTCIFACTVYLALDASLHGLDALRLRCDLSSSKGEIAGGGAGKEDSDVSGRSGTTDRLLGECSVSILGIACGRARQVDRWVPLGSGGELCLALSYDSLSPKIPPGDAVSLVAT